MLVTNDNAQQMIASAGTPLNEVFLIDLPWFTAVRTTFPFGDVLAMHIDPDCFEQDDRVMATGLLPEGASLVSQSTEIFTLGTEQEHSYVFLCPLPVS